MFLPPELAGQEEFRELEGVSAAGSSTDQLRRLYFQRLYQQSPDPIADRELVEQVLDHAKRVIAHPSRPMLKRLQTFEQNPFGELALDEVVEESPLATQSGDFAPADILVEEEFEKPFHCLLMLDTSSSMSGEKHLLASVAVAVLLLEVPPRHASLVVFSSQAQTIKRLHTEAGPAETVLRFLRTRPKGFTNIHAGLREGLGELGRLTGNQRRIGLMATDGRSTEGGDPMELARRFDFLVVLHLHGPGSHLDASREMAQAGNGICLEVETFEELPHRLYDAIRLLSRR